MIEPTHGIKGADGRWLAQPNDGRVITGSVREMLAQVENQRLDHEGSNWAVEPLPYPVDSGGMVMRKWRESRSCIARESSAPFISFREIASEGVIEYQWNGDVTEQFDMSFDVLDTIYPDVPHFKACSGFPWPLRIISENPQSKTITVCRV